MSAPPRPEPRAQACGHPSLGSRFRGTISMKECNNALRRRKNRFHAQPTPASIQPTYCDFADCTRQLGTGREGPEYWQACATLRRVPEQMEIYSQRLKYILRLHRRAGPARSARRASVGKRGSNRRRVHLHGDDGPDRGSRRGNSPPARDPGSTPPGMANIRAALCAKIHAERAERCPWSSTKQAGGEVNVRVVARPNPRSKYRESRNAASIRRF